MACALHHRKTMKDHLPLLQAKKPLLQNVSILKPFLALHTLLYNYFFDRIFFRNHSSYRLKNLDCEYSGVVHQSGETWSPGPCVPKCHCDNGHIKCSKLECPDLNCDKPVKRRWKCCPECLPNAYNGMFYHCSYYIWCIHILLLIQWTVDQREL